MIKIYLTSLILILFTACSITTKETYKTYQNYKLIHSTLNSKNKELFELLQAYIKQKNWLACIIKVEQKIQIEKTLETEYYNIIGYCYYSLEIYNLAIHYYTKALKQEPNNMITLLSLGKTYKITQKFEKAYNIYNKIIILDSNNKIAKKQITMLNQYL
uniref:hypothetical protein n=1 Tax=Hypnea nidifica TaxID=673448 RepID=UPI0027D9E557|nr:hypothetical protein REP52_pgp172 [Hypnea nidifica]WCH54265.1 hypothetical protein [Hypnea nidifica]